MDELERDWSKRLPRKEASKNELWSKDMLTLPLGFEDGWDFFFVTLGLGSLFAGDDVGVVL
jgi:hypothetical protein